MWKWCFDWNLSLFCLLSGVQTSVTMSLLNRTEDNISIAAWTPQSSSSSVLPPSPSSFVPQSNCSVSSSPSSPPYNFYAVLLVLLIFCVVFGNVLVCVAVSREKALQTTTNYLIVSLAVSDLLLASLVMPWGVYLEVSPHVWDLNQTAAQFYNAYVNTTSSNRSFKRHIILWNVYMSFICLCQVVGEWRFSRIHCDVLLTLDVMMCTASILNLCAISIDRWRFTSRPQHRIILINTRAAVWNPAGTFQLILSFLTCLSLLKAALVMCWNIGSCITSDKHE